MNQPDSASGYDERDLDEMWECLKHVTPPLHTRVLIRDAVVSELALASKKRQGQGIPFWWRTMEIPLPIIAATIAILLGLSASHIRLNTLSNEGTNQDYASAKDPLESSGRESDAGPHSEATAFRQSMTYLCGIGTLRTETNYFPEELER